MQFLPLRRSFYEPSAEIVAPRLLGHWLVRNTVHGICAAAIVETEAYLSNDPACHAAVGETQRNRAMWGMHGHAYVYLIYGNYFCFNTVCRPSGTAEAVLVRAVEPTIGEDLMLSNRPVKAPRDLTSGPGKLCLAMDIDRTLDGVDLCDATAPLFVAENPQIEDFLKSRGPMITTTRIGISKAADWPLRFYLDGSPFVSKRAAAGLKRRLPSRRAML